MSLQWTLVTVAALAACNSGKPMASSTEGKGGPGAPDQPPPGGPRETPDWSSKKLAAQTGEVDGLAFTIQVPEGLPRNPRNQADWETDEPAHMFHPKVYTSTIPINRIKDAEAAKYNATLDARTKTWVREESKDGSWALTMAEPDKSRIEVITYKAANDELYIKCKAVQFTGEGPLPSYAKTRQMLEAVCDSLTPTGAAPEAGDGDADAPK